MPSYEVPNIDLDPAPQGTPTESPSPSEVSSASSPEPHNFPVAVTPLFRVLTLPPPEPEQPRGQEELERRLPGYRRIVIPRDLTLIEMLRQSSGATTDEEVLRIREAKLRVVAERVGLRRLHVLVPYLRSLTLDGSAISSLRDLGIGLVHLKILSINRCGLTNLDGVWGLGALRELYAAGNPLKNLQPLAALQKLHTLDLANTPISEITQVWMLAICGSLRRLTLDGSPISGEPNYRAEVATALPMLIYLDGHPLHTDIENELIDTGHASSSESENEDEKKPTAAAGAGVSVNEAVIETESKPSSSKVDIHATLKHDGEKLVEVEVGVSKPQFRRRPATTDNAGARPKLRLPPRPATAHGRPSVDAQERLHVMHTLMDEDWCAAGSKLTSRSAFCGNFAQALRRSTGARRKQETDAQKQLIESGVETLERAIAAEIPRAPRLEDWNRFKEKTGIDIDIDFTKRPEGRDAKSAIDRLERLEKETAERLANPDKFREDYSVKDRANFTPLDEDLWKLDRDSFLDSDSDLWRLHFPPTTSTTLPDIDTLFRDIGIVSSPEQSLPD